MQARCHELLVAFSCKGRGLCPSCGARRAPNFAAFLAPFLTDDGLEEVLGEVDHDQWVFTLPEMPRPYLMHRREILGDLCRLAYETVLQMSTHCPDG